jgi:chaperonin GroEL
MQYVKAKSASKIILGRGPALKSKILDTMATISNIVGGTLGPGGHPVLIERQEYDLPPIITKDGVTVFRNLGFQDAIAQCILEGTRDASVRTATEAGDGTTTATVLAEALIRLTYKFSESNSRISPQSVVRKIDKAFREVLDPALKSFAIPADLESDEGRSLLRSVAKISGNGDSDLADAVMKCFDICGDDGNVTIVEGSGVSSYEVEKIEGYPIAMGYEESCQRFYSAFINRQDLQQVHIEKPAFLLYFGRVNDIETLVPVLQRLQEAYDTQYLKTPNLVVVATGFSESVLAGLMNNWVSPGSINVFPLLVPNNSPVHNAQRNFLDDLGGIVGAEVYDPITNPLDEATFNGIGNISEGDDSFWHPGGVRAIEVSRYRTTVVGIYDDGILIDRADVVRAQRDQAESELERTLIDERLAKLTGGIAKLKVIGSSNGEVKERRDRAEDAVCAVRGAIKSGVLVGGGWALLKASTLIEESGEDSILSEILVPALIEPTRRLMRNCGFAEDTIENTVKLLSKSATMNDEAFIVELSTGNVAPGKALEVYDSFPAVREALKNAISIATLFGTLGGVVAQPRDHEVDKTEAKESAEFNKTIGHNFADERP